MGVFIDFKEHLISLITIYSSIKQEGLVSEGLCCWLTTDQHVWILLVESLRAQYQAHKLFILYINDICRVSMILKLVLFADDTDVFCSEENLQQLLEVVTTEMSKLKRWLKINKLSLNLNKTKFLLF